MIGAIILSITIAAFLAGGIVLIVKGTKVRLPEGYKKNISNSDNNINNIVVIVDHNISGIKDKNNKEVVSFIVGGEKLDFTALTKACEKAVSVTELAFKEKNIKKANMKKVIFHILPDVKFDEPTWARKAAAYLGTSSSMFGKEVPRVVIREKFMKKVINKGQPAIHEMVHALYKKTQGNHDRNHAENNLWIKFGSDTIEAFAERMFETYDIYLNSNI